MLMRPRPLRLKVRPEDLGFRRADVQADDLAPAVGVDGNGDYRRDRDDAAGRPDLEVGDVEPQVGPFSPASGRGEEDPTAFLGTLSRLPITVDRTPGEDILALARRHRLTVYDAAYLDELARRGRTCRSPHLTTNSQTRRVPSGSL
jgi:hypothetical protein